jgi:hypothetical protein
MNTSDNFPTAAPQSQTNSGKTKNIVIAVLAAALIGTGTYAIVDSNKSSGVIQQQQTQIATVSDEKSDVQKSFDASLVRLDSMKTVNTNIQGKLDVSNKEIDKDKAEIRTILNKKNATAAELHKAKDLIASLNGKITDEEAQIAQLTKDKEQLTADKQQLTQDKEQLTQDLTTTTAQNQVLSNKVDVASTLNASNIVITPVKVKGNGKEKETTTAKRVDKLMISFNVDNRIATPGPTDVYVQITGPDGKVITTNAASGTFTTRENGDQSFTAKVPVTMDSSYGKKNVEFAITPSSSHFTEGSYKIQIYQNGFVIGEATQELKKGGLFS